MGKLFLSHRLEWLAGRLARELSRDTRPPLVPRTILVPHACLKQWLMIRLSDDFDGIAGCRILTMEEGLRTLWPASEQMPSALDIVSAIFDALGESQEEEVREYCKSNLGRLAELSWALAQLFSRYGLLRPQLLASNASETGWQRKLIRKQVLSGILRIPQKRLEEPVHCFGFDFLPPMLWDLLCGAPKSQTSVYLFSPCRHFWEDLCTDLERKQLDRYWKKRGASESSREELDRYLRNAPPLLANWGKAGRETLKSLEPFNLEAEEDEIQTDEPVSNLGLLKQRLLDFVSDGHGDAPADCSLRISKAGASPLQEIECLRQSILELAQNPHFQYSDVSVLAPDIQPFAPLIELVCHDLPIRITGVPMSLRSPFYQGMCCFLDLALEGKGSLAKLFENASFCKARGWGAEEMELFRNWTQSSVREEEWEEALLDQYVYLFPQEKKRRVIHSADIIQKWICAIREVKEDVQQLQKPHALPEWAALLARCIKTHFFIDGSMDEERAAIELFQKTLREFAEAKNCDSLYPLALIEKLVKRFSLGDLHASHLHAIRFASLEEGVCIPSRFLFLIGMDEESFPRQSKYSSLDLLREERVYTFETRDRDRYLLLQALFSARERVHFSYNDLSREEGKPIDPSPLIGELGVRLQEAKGEGRMAAGRVFPRISWPQTPVQCLPEGEMAVSLADLKALLRHPWNFFLQKTQGIYVGNLQQGSFAMQRRQMLRSALAKPVDEVWEMYQDELPIGLCGKALKKDLIEAYLKWKGYIEEWDVVPGTLSLRMGCRALEKVGRGWEAPPVEIAVSERLKVWLTGEIRTFSSKGFLHGGDDSIEGLLPVWAECLAALSALPSSAIHFLKNGRVKTVERPKECLRNLLNYFFLSLSAPSPLLPEWGDALLRKSVTEWGKKVRDRIVGKGNRFDDPVFDWVLSRVDLPEPGAWFPGWQSILKEQFAGLAALYPKREQHAAI